MHAFTGGLFQDFTAIRVENHMGLALVQFQGFQSLIAYVKLVNAS
jgi:hypothetical protein